MIFKIESHENEVEFKHKKMQSYKKEAQSNKEDTVQVKKQSKKENKA